MQLDASVWHHDFLKHCLLTERGNALTYTPSCPTKVGAMRTRWRKQWPFLAYWRTVVEVGFVLGGVGPLDLWRGPWCWRDGDEDMRSNSHRSLLFIAISHSPCNTRIPTCIWLSAVVWNTCRWEHTYLKMLPKKYGHSKEANTDQLNK